MSFSDDSDLTDLSSDESDVPLAASKPQTRVKTRKQPVITPALRAPRTVSYSVECLYKKLSDGALDLDPEYQRDVVWNDAKQSQLIDSLIHNYYIPPLIFAVSVMPNGEEKRTCIDGKQRLSSIQRFTDGLVHKDSVTQGKFWYISGAGRTRSRTVLPQQLKSRFSNTQITCVEYDYLTQDQEREIFRRVQLGVALTPAERLQAITGPLASLVRGVQDLLASPAGLEGHVPWGKARGRDFLCVAQIIYLIDGKKAEPSAPKIEAWLTDDKAATITPKLQRNIDTTVAVLCTLAHDAALSKPLNDKKVSPIEFVMITYMIFLHRDKLSFTQLSDAAAQLRKNVRARFPSIRFNTETYNHVLGYLKQMKTMSFESDREGDQPASQCVQVIKEVLHQPSTTVTSAKGKESATGRKRRRVVAAEESEADECIPVSVKAEPIRKRPTKAVQTTTTSSSSGATQPLTTSAPQTVTPDQPSLKFKIKIPPSKPKTTTKPKIPAIDDDNPQPQLATPRKKRPSGSVVIPPPPQMTGLPTPDPTPVECPWTALPEGSRANPLVLDPLRPMREAKARAEAMRRGAAPNPPPPPALRDSERRRSRSRSRDRYYVRRRGSRCRGRSRSRSRSCGRSRSRSRSPSRRRYNSRRRSRSPERYSRRRTRSRSVSPRRTRPPRDDPSWRGRYQR
ncbi:hypothetical protein EV421DRAFT_1502172 [Armillaria borealis]|uniref:GmrSD restriction endonucleases N-terminal domain-containing protein n=1 Tax=Armillaria borealis TaxID=47425 RepID=A0AA39IXT5_9AGAR|nr:hypothetical protein EV421DRAFT_1502172 [Armillaria borealis]